MKKGLGLLVVSLFFSLQVLAQAQLPDIQLFRGNPYTISLIVTAADSALPTTAVLYASPLSRTPLTADKQPTVIRAGRIAYITWNQTNNLPDIRSWLEISAGNLIKWTVWISTTKRPPITINPSDAISGPVPAPGSTSKVFPLSSVLNSGFVVTHNKSNRFVTGTFFREDTDQPDALWRIKIRDDNSVEIAGPPGETFTGKLVLNFTFQLSN